MSQEIDRFQLANFGSLELLAKQVVEGFITGLHKSPFHGFSVEFAEHRLYNKGESTRHIDWKLFARSEKLFTKKYEEETNLRCQIVLDCSSSMNFKHKSELSKLEFAVYSAASLIELLKKQRDAVGVSLFSTKLDFHSPCKSSVAHHRMLYHELEKKLVPYNEDTKKNTDSVSIIHDIAELCHKRSMVILFTDLLDNPEKQKQLFEALRHLKHNKHEVVLIHTVEPAAEIDFNLDNRPYQLIDMETGEKIKLNPSALKEQYKNAIKTHFNAVESTCLQYNIDYVLADINKGYQQILVQYLLKRQKMSV